MPKIPRDVAEKIYANYEITLQDPMPFEDMFKAVGVGEMFEISDVHRHAYERGIVKPEGQVFWIHGMHKKVANPDEPYDMGMLNAFELIAHIYSAKDPVYGAKPETRVAEVKKLKKNNKAAMERAKKLRADYTKGIDDLKAKLRAEKDTVKKLTSAHAGEIKKLNAAIDELQKE